MAFTLADITNEIRVVIGDPADQFNSTTGQLKIENEIKNTVLFLTSRYTFLWNTRETSLAHTSGVLTAPSNMAKILFLSDSGKNEKYYSAPAEEYYMIKRNADRAIEWSESQPVPYFLTVSPTTGAETISLGTLSDTPASLSFYIVYTEYTDDVTTVWIPARLRPFIISETASNLLVKLDSPDMNLVVAHQQIATACLNREIGFNNTRQMSAFNMNLNYSPNSSVRVSSGFSL